MIWTIELLNRAVEKEIAALPKDMQARFLHIGDLLQSFGPQQVGMPYVRPIGSKLWEMRLSGKSSIGRAIYIASHGKRLVVLHAFIKKTQKTPSQAIELALTRMKEIEP